jgi:hypothetical protein
MRGLGSNECCVATAPDLREAGKAESERSSMKSLTMKSLLWAGQWGVAVSVRVCQCTEKVSRVKVEARLPRAVLDVFWVRIDAVSGLALLMAGRDVGGITASSGHVMAWSGGWWVVYSV